MQQKEALRILGLPPHATPSQIKAAYRIEAKKVHPDVGGTAEMFDRVTTAYDVLMNASIESDGPLSFDVDQAPHSSSSADAPDLSALGPIDDPLIPTDHIAILRVQR